MVKVGIFDQLWTERTKTTREEREARKGIE